MCGYKSDGNMFRREPSIFPPGNRRVVDADIFFFFASISILRWWQEVSNNNIRGAIYVYALEYVYVLHAVAVVVGGEIRYWRMKLAVFAREFGRNRGRLVGRV